MTLNGISGAAVVRAADSMLYALGGTEISVMFPSLTLPDDSSAQLGLVDPGVEEVSFSPVVVRILEAGSAGPRRRLEFLISGATVTEELSSRNVATAETLFANALGIVYRGDLLHIENVVTEYFADAAYLCRVLAVE
jgi:hypothetical protein